MTDKTKKKKFRVNLPQTPFPMKASLATREPERLKVWGEEQLEKNIFETARTREKRAILHDGPPYANGRIHIGHALNKTLKDIIVKHKTMTGHDSTYVPGWDCHGLPIEHACLKEMGKRKDQVDRIEFRKQARAYAEKYIGIQREEFRRLGIFGEWDNPYLTMNYGYQASIIKSFWEIYEKGFVEQHLKPVPWCFDCETALADAELEYEDRNDTAVFTAFEVDPADEANQAFLTTLGGQKVSVIIWTTTPWTLPANVGVAYNPGVRYGTYQTDQGLFIFAENLRGTLQEKCGWKECSEIEACTPLAAEGSIPFQTVRHPFLNRTSRLIPADYVSDTDGTGFVHIAPGHGEEDYAAGYLGHGLDILSPVDEKGRFFEDTQSNFVKEHAGYAGLHVFKANPEIVTLLESKGALLHQEKYAHSYPHCWRCKKPIIFRATPQWFMKIDHRDLRKRLGEVIDKEVQFFPDWGKNRIGSMVENRPDWCLSRQRLWGVPIPVAYRKDSGDVFLNESFKKRVLEIVHEEGADAWFARPVKDFFPDQPELADQIKFETDILDVWFDSGVSHQAVLESGHELGFPCELYLEGSDQHRGWFQTSLVTSVALRNESPFRKVLTHGFVMDGQGKKMSKSLGNVVAPQDVMKKYGADILRLWVSSVDTNNDVRMSPEILERMAEAYRKIRNTFRYLLGNLSGFDPETHSVPFDKLESIDRWVLSRLNETAKEIEKCYEEFRFHRIYQLIYDFCISDLSSFYLDTLKDRLYCDPAEDPKRRSSQTAIFRMTKTLCQLAAPVLVFTTDEIWRNFPLGPEPSVHASLWESSIWGDRDEAALRHWNAVRRIREAVDSVIEPMRETKEIGSSLDCEVTLSGAGPELESFLKGAAEEIELGLIVSAVSIAQPENGKEVDLNWVTMEGKERSEKLFLAVKRAGGTKCGRCWKYRDEVGSLADPLLCERCQKVETALGPQSD